MGTEQSTTTNTETTETVVTPEKVVETPVKETVTGSPTNPSTVEQTDATPVTTPSQAV